MYSIVDNEWFHILSVILVASILKGIAVSPAITKRDPEYTLLFPLWAPDYTCTIVAQAYYVIEFLEFLIVVCLPSYTWSCQPIALLQVFAHTL